MLKSLSGSPEWLSDTHTKKKHSQKTSKPPIHRYELSIKLLRRKKALTTGFFDPNLGFEGVTIETS